MTNPWMIMLLGIITVFVVLFLIILFLLGFPGFFGALKRREHGKPAPLPQIIEVTKKLFWLQTEARLKPRASSRRRKKKHWSPY